MKDKTTAILLAVFLSFWTFLYTYKEDKVLFWVYLVVVFLFWWILFIPCLVAWIHAIILATSRDEQWYKDFDKKTKTKAKK